MFRKYGQTHYDQEKASYELKLIRTKGKDLFSKYCLGYQGIPTNFFLN